MTEHSKTQFGALGKIEGRWISGWAYDPDRPSSHLRIVVLLDGDVAGFALANIFEQKLLENGLGDGTHGFRCELSLRKLVRARLITIIAERHGSFVLIHESRLDERSAPPLLGEAAPRLPAIHFDISDLLEFLVHHREVSGIQRVQCGYVSNALALPEQQFLIRVCAQVPGTWRYVEIARERAAALLLAIEGRRSLPLREWQNYIAIERRGTGRAPEFQPGDILLTLGAPWVHDDYYVAIEAAKAAHGIRYFQVFHDLIPTLMPEVVAVGLIGGFTRSIAGMLDCADHVLANSRYSQSDLVSTCARLRLNCPPTSVIPLGGTIDYRQDDPTPQPAPPSPLPSPRERYGDFVLCVGTIEPRKNHLYLYRVWKRMLRELGPGIPKLVCVGRMGWHVDELKRYLKISANLEGYFVHLADVGDTELKRFYEDCLFTVFPSLYEGWGLPVAESLLYRKLCVSSKATSMPEVGGDWIVYIDPDNVNDGVDVISGLLQDRPRIAALEQRLRDSYVPLTWRAATKGLLQVVAEAAAGLPPVAARDTSAKTIVRGQIYKFHTADPEADPLQALASETLLRSTSLLLDGADWHQVEDWGCWACGPVARLRFTLPYGAHSALVCYLALRLPGHIGPQACRILVNGAPRGEFRLIGGQGDHEICLTLGSYPATCSGHGQEIRLELRLGSFLQPEPNHSEQRVLGIGVRTLCICAADDFAERLAYAERNIDKIPQREQRAERL